MSITDQYQYLGVKLRPSGSLNYAVEELCDKAKRAWFGISNIVHKHKRMEADRVLGIFDSLVTPIALYSCEFWMPYVVKKSSFSSIDKLIENWESFTSETINQQCCRLFLSVHNKSSRLAVLGELGRYPLFLKSVAQCMWSLTSMKEPNNSLMRHVIEEMSSMASKGQDCWLTRVSKIEQLFNLKQHKGYAFNNNASGKTIMTKIKSKFDSFWVRKINEFKPNKNDPLDHNKLRTYKMFKGSFTREPYIDYIRNRNQRSYLTRLRIGAHSLAIELGRRHRPITPIRERVCLFCQTDVHWNAPNQTCYSNLEFGA